MKLDRAASESTRSAAIVPTMWLTLMCSGLVMFSAYASDPGWWSSRGAVNYSLSTNGYPVANIGQLKQFTAAAVVELNADFTNSGGAGPVLSNLVYGWQQDYLTNGYETNTANPTKPYKPSDLMAANVGQLKYIASLIYNRLADDGYTELTPIWIQPNTNSDYMAANLGQVKEVFDFDLSLAGPISLSASTNSGGTINLDWTPPSTNLATSYLLEQQNVDGSWSTIATVTNSATTNYSVTNLAPGENPEFQIIAQNSSSVSIPQTTPGDSGLIAPSNVQASPGAAAGEIDVTWQNNATDATYIIIYESPDGVAWTPIATLTDPTATSYAVKALAVGQTYYFGVSAGND